MTVLSTGDSIERRTSSWQRLVAGFARGPLVAALMAVAMASPAIEEPPAQVLVRDNTDQVLAVLKERKDAIAEDPTEVYGLVDEFILPHFDFRRMSRRVLGKYWRNATREQRKRFVQEFQTLLVRTYAIALARYSDETVEYLSPRERRDGSEISVRTQIILAGGPPIPINYEMYLKNGAWKVYDVAIDGVSLVINYRTTFISQVRQNGVEGLIDRLVQHNAGKGSVSQ